MGQCQYSESPPPPKKEKIEITGEGGVPLCACADISHAKYVSVDPPSLGYEVKYYTRGEAGAAHHTFAVGFSNLQPYSAWYVCPKDEILSCGIHVNGKKVGTIGECTHSTAEQSSRPGHLLITHHFSFHHQTTPWGFSENFSLNLLCGPLPKDITANIEKKLENSGSKRL